MTQQDFEKWKDEEAEKLPEMLGWRNDGTAEPEDIKRAGKFMADAAYNLLSKEIGEKDEEKMESDFIDKLIKELPSHGIDTSMWEYNYGDCCDDAVEFLARVIKESRASQFPSQGLKWVKASERLPEPNIPLWLKVKLSETASYRCEGFLNGWIHFTTNSGQKHPDEVEWLDESAPSQGLREATVNISTAQELIKKATYWKTRCEAAEKVVINETNDGYNQADYEKWYNLSIATEALKK